MEALKVLGGVVVVVGVLTIRWVHVGWETRAATDGRGEGLLGGLYGGLLGFALGWMLTDSVAVGVVTAVAGAVLLGWRNRAVTILTAAEADAQPVPRLGPERVKGTPVTFALAGAFCGLIAGVTAGTLFDQHGAVLAVETMGASAFLAWQFVQRSNRWRR